MLPFLVGQLGEPTAQGAQQALDQSGLFSNLAGNLLVLVLGVALIGATVVLVGYLKNVLANSLIGLVTWAVLHFLFQVQLPLVPSIIVSAIFALGGIGVMLVLKFLGVNF